MHPFGLALTGCVCATNGSCESPAVVYLQQLTTIFFIPKFEFTLPGLVERCSTVNSLLFSNLECFYSHTDCFMLLSTVKYSMNGDTRYALFPVRPIVANPAVDRFPPQTLVKEIIEHLMVERWHHSISYDRFYRLCAPRYCTYSQHVRSKGALQVVIALLSMLGGLVASLRTITPHLVRVVAFVKTLFSPRTRPAPRGNISPDALCRHIGFSFQRDKDCASE